MFIGCCHDDLILGNVCRDIASLFHEVIYLHIGTPELDQQAMRVALLLFALWAYLISSVTATALTYHLAANERACFYANVEQVGAKIAFYFAVSLVRNVPRHH